MKEDGTDLQKVIPNPIDKLISLSPDGRWIVASSDTVGPGKPQMVVGYQVSGGAARILCRACATGAFDFSAPIVSWPRDQKSVYVSNDNGKTIVAPLKTGEAFPKFPSDEIVNNAELLRVPGVSVLDLDAVFPGPDSSTYAVARTSSQRNLYRISLR
jgi:WD40-like Beta Propeller Repeat